MSLTTLESLKLQGGIPLNVNTYDLQYTQLLNGLTSVIERSLHRNIALRTYNEILSGDNSSVLQLNNRPIVSVSRVCLDDGSYFGQSPSAWPSTSDLVAGTDYSIMSGRHGLGSIGQLLRIGNVWRSPQVWSPGKVAPQASPPRGNILVVYQAGLSPVPAGLAYAMNAAVLRAFTMANIGGAAQSMSYEDGAVTLFSPEDMAKVMGSVERTLGSYRAVVG